MRSILMTEGNYEQVLVAMRVVMSMQVALGLQLMPLLTMQNHSNLHTGQLQAVSLGCKERIDNICKN